MSAFPQIDAVKVVVQPAVEEITFSKMWVTNLQVQSPSPTAKAPALVGMKPYNPDLQVVSSNQKDFVQMQLEDVFADAKENPLTVGLAIGVLLGALNLLFTRNHLASQMNEIVQLIKQNQAELSNLTKQQDQWNAQPDSIQKASNLAGINARVQILKDQLATFTQNQAALQPNLDAAKAALAAPIKLPDQLAQALNAAIQARNNE